MRLKPIRNDEQHEEALAELAKLLRKSPRKGSPERDKLEMLEMLVETYEQQRYPIDPPDPVDAIKFRMEQEGLRAKDLIPYLGSKSKVSEVLNRKRELSLTMIRRLHKGLGIPLAVLIREPEVEAKSA